MSCIYILIFPVKTSEVNVVWMSKNEIHPCLNVRQKNKDSFLKIAFLSPFPTVLDEVMETCFFLFKNC